MKPAASLTPLGPCLGTAGKRPTRFRILAVFGLLLAGSVRPAAAVPVQPLLLGGEERILVMAAHPDDEILAAGGLIQEARTLDVPVRVCLFTMGDNNEIAFLFTRRHPARMPGALRSSGLMRQNEALAAIRQLGLSTNELVFLGYPDVGTLDIWNGHWRTVPPFRSRLSRADAVPYDRALTPGSAYAGEDILDDLEEVIRDFRPTHVVVPHPADHNVDHRALYLFTRVALWNVAADGIVPEILAAPVHFTQWPEPRRYHPMRPASPPFFLAEAGDWLAFSLAPFQVSNKLAAIRRHHSQYRNAAPYLNSLIRKSELFQRRPDLPFPAGVGEYHADEEDVSQFRSDEALFQELARESGQWVAIAEQNRAETAAIGDLDNDFLGQSISGDGSRLTVSFSFRKPVSAATSLTIRLFGYRTGTRFGDMPKLIVVATPQNIVSVRDLATALPPETVELVPAAETSITLRVPFERLGWPDRLLVGAQLMKGDLPIDWTAWRAIDLAGIPAKTHPPAGAAPAPPALPPPDHLRGAEPPGTARPDPELLKPRVGIPRRTPPPRKPEAEEVVFW